MSLKALAADAVAVSVESILSVSGRARPLANDVRVDFARPNRSLVIYFRISPKNASSVSLSFFSLARSPRVLIHAARVIVANGSAKEREDVIMPSRARKEETHSSINIRSLEI